MLSKINPDDLFRHLAVFGATGSGKTRSVILPLLERALGHEREDPERRAGAIIFDVKGDMPDHVAGVMRAAGRDDEIITIGRGSNAWFDPFGGIENDSRAVAERLIEIVRGLHAESGGGSYDDFWRENNRRLLQVAAVVARARGHGDLGGVEGIASAIELICACRTASDEDEGDDRAKKFLEAAAHGNLIPEPDARMALRYIETEAKGLASNTWSVVTNYAQAYVSCLRDGKIAGVLTPSASHQFVPEDIVDRGRVALVSLSRVHFGPAAEVFRNMIKTAFQSCALQRHCRSHFDGRSIRPVNRVRPVLFVADEFPSFVTPGSEDDGDAFFLDKCREVRVGCVLSCQGVSALTARLRSPARASHLLNNCCTKIFMATDCAETLAYFESAVPEREEREEDVLFGHVPAPAMFRLPNYEFGPHRNWVPRTKTSSRPRGPKFDPSALRALKVGEGILLRPQGFAERVQFPAFAPSP